MLVAIARSTTTRSVGLAAALVSLLGVITLARGAIAEPNPEQATARIMAARDTQTLASDTLRDYHRGSRGIVTKLTKGCCGAQVINVYYLAKPGSYAKYGAYGLEAVFAHGRLSPSTVVSMAIIEFPTYRRYTVGSTARTPTYQLTLSHGAEPDWFADLSFIGHSDLRYTTGEVALHEEATFLTPADLSVFYAQALHVLHKAEAHAPVTLEEYLHPGLPCGLEGDPACVSG